MMQKTINWWLISRRLGGCWWLPVVLCLLSGGAVLASDPPAAVRSMGAGSYWHGLPPAVKGPPALIYRTEEADGPMPSNDWWSSLAWLPLSETMFPHPLAV